MLGQTPGVLLVAGQLVVDILDLVEAAVALVDESVVPEENWADAIEFAGQLAIVDFAERAKSVANKAGKLDGDCHFGHLFLLT